MTTVRFIRSSIRFLFEKEKLTHILILIDTRALFERALAVMPNEQAATIWQKFANYEHKYGDMTGIEKVERRWREAFPSGKSCSNLIVNVICFNKYTL